MGVVAGAVVLGMLIVGLLWLIKSYQAPQCLKSVADVQQGRALNQKPSASVATSSAGKLVDIASVRAKFKARGNTFEGRRVMSDPDRDHNNPTFDVMDQVLDTESRKPMKGLNCKKVMSSRS